RLQCSNERAVSSRDVQPFVEASAPPVEVSSPPAATVSRRCFLRRASPMACRMLPAAGAAPRFPVPRSGFPVPGGLFLRRPPRHIGRRAPQLRSSRILSAFPPSPGRPPPPERESRNPRRWTAEQQRTRIPAGSSTRLVLLFAFPFRV